MFQVFVSRDFAFLFVPAGPYHSPFLSGAEWYYRLDALFFAWASRVIPRAIAAQAVSPHFADILEDMRIHLSLTDPSALTAAFPPGRVELPTLAADHFVHSGDIPPWRGFSSPSPVKAYPPLSMSEIAKLRHAEDDSENSEDLSLPIPNE
jgi:hypothetical protein